MFSLSVCILSLYIFLSSLAAAWNSCCHGYVQSLVSPFGSYVPLSIPADCLCVTSSLISITPTRAPTRASCVRSESICSGSPGTPQLGPWQHPMPCPRTGWWRHRRDPATRMEGWHRQKGCNKHMTWCGLKEEWMTSSFELNSYYSSSCWGQWEKTNSETKQTMGSPASCARLSAAEWRLLKWYEKD